MTRKGIVLAGGSGTRLHPCTVAVSKQLLPVYDKPLIYYPIATLMLAGIRDILLITTPHDQPLFQRQLGNGESWGIKLTYAVQPEPNGLAEAFLIGQKFLDGSPSALILGDNVFFGQGLPEIYRTLSKDTRAGATILGYYVSDPKRYGVVSFDENGKIDALEEKPAEPKSHYAVPGFYFYDGTASERARRLKPSIRGELEITDLNLAYLRDEQLRVQILGRGSAWLDLGTHESLLDGAQFVRVIEERQGLKICCPEEIAWRMGFIDNAQLARLAKPLAKNGYGRYLLALLKEAA